jgi:peptidoglycan/xylan/chitin deacetylase (PgdA/CDA1 family)
MYHDVVPPGDWAASGFPGAGADIYKLERDDFARHLAAIKVARPSAPPTLVPGSPLPAPTCPLYLTFDDGGVSAFTEIAPLLEQYGWRGHFFITTDRIGTPGFLTAAQLRELDRSGHLIGSHSCSHPLRISACSWDELRREWIESAHVLSEILGKPVSTASIPGGFYSRRVAEAAELAGIRILFTSEPTTRIAILNRCRILGRYGIWRGMPPAVSGAIAAGRRAPRWKQTAWWEFKKLAKKICGNRYLQLRQRLVR